MIYFYFKFKEKRQAFIDNIYETKTISNDPEKNLNRLTKDDKVRSLVFVIVFLQKRIYFSVFKLFFICVLKRKN